MKIQVSTDIRVLLQSTIKGYEEMGAPAEDVALCRRRADALMEALNRLVDWRKATNRPSPLVEGFRATVD
ncbi:MAG: hypothetical protein OXQ29_17460 [Rhodospirillaceae bacterium]|nr:hypothetical protein [Rhodospirillaceae bacterium]